MSLSRRCPNCTEPLPIGGVRFDAEYSVLCPHCNKPILAGSPKAEHSVIPKNAPKSQVASGDYYGGNMRIGMTPKIPPHSAARSIPRQANGIMGDEYFGGDYG